MGRVATRVMVSLFVLASVAFVTFSGLAQTMDDPRNTSEEYYDAIDKALCMAHHALEGMEPIDVSFSPRYSVLPVGQQVDLQVRLRNPWLHQVHDMQVIVNTSKAQNVEVITGDREPNLENNNIVVDPAQTPVGEANAYEQKFEVGTNASKVIVYAAFASTATVAETAGQRPDINVRLAGVEGRKVDLMESKGETKARIMWDKSDLQTAGSGVYTLEFWLDEGANQLPQDSYTLTYGYNVYNNATSQTEFVFALPGVAFRGEGEAVTVNIPVIMHTDAEGVIDVAAFVRTHFDHPAGTNAANDGHFYRFTTMNVKGGSQLLLAQGSASGPVLLGATVDITNLMTRVIGFMTMLLVPVAMVTGGMFGKSSRRWLNRITGGAKKRVLWHSAMSWIILGVASIHFVLALVEARNTWEVGMFWGGLGWALLVSLGITGYYQVRMIKRWNYKTWRWTHLGTAIGVFVFGILHTFIEGSDLGGVRDAMPWIAKLVFP